MRRTLLPALCGLFLIAPALVAQLPLLTVPTGTLRIEFGGGFFPTDHQWVAGTRQPLGNLLTASSLGAAQTPLIADLASRLNTITGQASGVLSLGGLTATAEQERGVGTVGLGLGVTSRISLFMTVPIVFVRSRYQSAYDPTTATVGLNPAHPTLGDAGGQAQAATFFSQFDTAMATLTLKITQGDFAGDAAALALAQQTLTDGARLRSALYTLLADPARALPVLPTSASSDGVALLARVSALETTFSNRLGVAGFTAAPALPVAPLTAQSFTTLLTAPDGFGRASADDRPRTALGDIEAGVTVQLLQRGNPGEHWLAAWGRGLMRFPNGSLPRPSQLFDQGTGDRQFDAELSGIVEFGAGRLGLRSELTYNHQFARVVLTDIGRPDQLLLPAYRSAALSQDLGDVVSLTATPFFRLAPHLAVTGMASYWRKGADQYQYATGQGEIFGASLSELSQGTAADALRLGIGFSYVHPGEVRDRRMTMPVEAGFSLERTVASGRGIVASPLTTRMTFRVYAPLFRH